MRRAISASLKALLPSIVLRFKNLALANVCFFNFKSGEKTSSISSEIRLRSKIFLGSLDKACFSLRIVSESHFSKNSLFKFFNNDFV